MDQTLPQWIEYVGKSGGRDHLGLQSVGQNILEELTSGYSNITQRLRYYSLYTWITKAFFDSDIKKDAKHYRQFLQKIVLLYTVSNGIFHTSEANTGIDGIQFVRDRIPSNLSEGDTVNIKELVDDFNDNHWMYKAKLDDIKLTYFNDESGVPALTDPYGFKLAKAFADNLKIDPVKLNYSSVSYSELKKLEESWCYHRLDENDKEKQWLEDLLFARLEGLGDRAINRRYSLVLFLMHLDETGKLDRHSFELWLEKDTGMSEGLARVRNMWQMLFIRNRQVYSTESLMYFFLSLCKDAYLTQSNLEPAFKSALKSNSADNDKSKLLLTYWGQPLSKLAAELKNKSSQKSGWQEYMIIRPLLEQTKSERRKHEVEHLSLGFMSQLAIFNRLSSADLNEEEKWLTEFGGERRQSLKNLQQLFTDYIKQNLTVKEALLSFMSNHVLSRHLLVATEKFFDRKKDTYHFNLNDNNYNLNSVAQSFSPQYNFMKLNQALNFFEDLGLVKVKDNAISLTNRGQAIVQEFNE